MALGFPGRLRPRIILTFGTTRVVGRQPYAPAAFTPGEIPGTHFQGLSRPQNTWFCWDETRKKSLIFSRTVDGRSTSSPIQKNILKFDDASSDYCQYLNKCENLSFVYSLGPSRRKELHLFLRLFRYAWPFNSSLYEIEASEIRGLNENIVS